MAGRRAARTGAGRHHLHGLHAVREALAAGRRRVHALRISRAARGPEVAAAAEAARKAGVPVLEVDPEALDALVPRGTQTQGVVLEAESLPELALEDLVARGPEVLVALDGVEDPQNLGAIARVGDAAGISGLVLTERRAPPLSPAVVRASAGAVEWLPVARVANLGRALKYLKDNDFWVFGCDPEGDLDLYALPDRIQRGRRVVVLGAEGRGLRPGVRQHVDHAIRIPMGGRVASLNVAAAAAVVLFELGRRDRLATSS